MTDGDSGVDTGSESNESNSMSIGSPSRSDEDKFINFGINYAEFQQIAGPSRIESEISNSSHDIVNFVEESGASYSKMAVKMSINWPSSSEVKLGYNYFNNEFVGKKKRRKFICSYRYDQTIPKLKHIIGERKLRAAANSQAIETVRNLLDMDVNPCASDSKKRTALHFAAAAGQTEIAKLLLERGADPNQRDSVGNTPLHLAACTTNIEMVTLLLKAGTDVNALDNSGRSPFHLAQSKLKLLQMNKEYSSAQMKTEVVNVLEMMQVYLQRSGRGGEEFINTFSNRLHQHQTREEVDSDVKDLLSSLSHLSLQTS